VIAMREKRALALARSRLADGFDHRTLLTSSSVSRLGHDPVSDAEGPANASCPAKALGAGRSHWEGGCLYTPVAALRPIFSSGGAARGYDRAMRRRAYVKITLAAVVAVIAAGALGYRIGHGNRGAAFVAGPGIVYAGQNDGTAYIGAGQPLDRQPRGFAYLFSSSVPWIDETGTIHEGGQRPPCVPISHAVHVNEIQVVKYPIGGANMGTVLWVRC
jgi:hypothetical protein